MGFWKIVVMGKLYIASNRLPVSIQKEESGRFRMVPSVGGLATGMRSIYKDYGGKWIGWPGIASDDLDRTDNLEEMLRSEQCVPVYLDKEEINLYYEGFSNNVVWPLFHYFTHYIEYSEAYWEAYERVNRKFAEKALEVLAEGDTIWIHDYQLLLMPEMIKVRMPEVTIGFFLHIPFPSFEVFRILPRRKELIKGMLGADLIGFHTYDYERYFFSTVIRLFGHEISFNRIHLEDRIIVGDVFPMGIDYKKFRDSARMLKQKTDAEKSELHLELEKYLEGSPDRKLILAIDRLDYTKGIPNRLRGFELFLERYPEYREKITLIMLVVPSRSEVEQYKLLKSEIDELVGRINGRFRGINYIPVWYFYRSLPFENLVELYVASDIALITPIRDGMNLVAKEYVACRINQTGCMILSEMAGVAKEMGEAIQINPNNEQEIAGALYQALAMPAEEQQERMAFMQQRLQRYDVFKWSGEFVKALNKIGKMQDNFMAKKITPALQTAIVAQFKAADKRAIFLDYDGTLVPFYNNPQAALPDEELHLLLSRLETDPRNELTIISGRDRETLQKWFAGHRVNLVAEHGVWLKVRGRDWHTIHNWSDEWKVQIRPVLEMFADRTPGTFIEEKKLFAGMALP